MCHTLVHELGCDHPNTTKELLDIATNGGRAAPSKATTNGIGKCIKGGKKRQKRCPRHVAIAASDSDGDKKS
jgi:hypothetical protein